MTVKKECLQYQLNLFKQIVGIRPVGRLLPVRSDDIWLVSYPKSGNTWLRFLLGNLISNEPVDFASIERVAPDIYVNSMQSLCQSTSPRVLKSHEPFDFRYQNVVYIVRDPRDVVVSYWKHQQKMQIISDNFPLDAFVAKFLDGTLMYGSWKEHVGSWLGARENEPGFILVRYEDLLLDAENVLRSIFNKIGSLPVKMDFSSAVAYSSFDRMKALEAAQSNAWQPTRKSEKNINFVREGKSAQWRERLPAGLSEQIWNKWGVFMDRLGYKP